MTALYLISLPLNLRSFRRWAAQRNLGRDEGVALHHLLGETFGKSVLQPFRLMVAPGAANATLYAYTAMDHASLTQTALETGMPDALAVCDPSRLAVKAMPESWTEGRRLAFDLRVRPVKRLLEPVGVFPKGAEVDAFLIEAIRRYPSGPPSEDRIDREFVYRQWLDERLGKAATVIQVSLARIERDVALRGGRELQGPDVTFHGELIIGNRDVFLEKLAKGVGRHAAYGYGMLLLRPSKR